MKVGMKKDPDFPGYYQFTINGERVMRLDSNSAAEVTVLLRILQGYPNREGKIVLEIGRLPKLF